MLRTHAVFVIILMSNSYSWPSVPPNDTIQKSYFLAFPMAALWFEKDLTERTTTVLERDNAHLISSLPDVSDTLRDRLQQHGICSYATEHDDYILAGFSNGSVLLINKKKNSLNHELSTFQQGQLPYNNPVTACSLSYTYHHPRTDTPLILAAYQDRSMILINRTTKHFYTFYNAHPEIVTHIIPGHLPNMWILGGGTQVSMIRFSYNSEHKLMYDKYCQSLPTQTESEPIVTGLGLYQCGIFVQTANHSVLMMPHSHAGYAIIKNPLDAQQNLLSKLVLAKIRKQPLRLTAEERALCIGLPQCIKKALTLQ